MQCAQQGQPTSQAPWISPHRAHERRLAARREAGCEHGGLSRRRQHFEAGGPWGLRPRAEEEEAAGSGETLCWSRSYGQASTYDLPVRDPAPHARQGPEPSSPHSLWGLEHVTEPLRASVAASASWIAGPAAEFVHAECCLAHSRHSVNVSVTSLVLPWMVLGLMETPVPPRVPSDSVCSSPPIPTAWAPRPRPSFDVETLWEAFPRLGSEGWAPSFPPPSLQGGSYAHVGPAGLRFLGPRDRRRISADLPAASPAKGAPQEGGAVDQTWKHPLWCGRSVRGRAWGRTEGTCRRGRDGRAALQSNRAGRKRERCGGGLWEELGCWTQDPGAALARPLNGCGRAGRGRGHVGA